MIVEAVYRLTAPRIKGGKITVLDLVSVAISLEPLGHHVATARVHVGPAFPSHGAGVVINGAEHFNLHAGLGHSNDLGKVSNAGIIAISADKNVTNLGIVDNSGLVF